MNDASRCPICGGANRCQIASDGRDADSAPYWCKSVEISAAMRAQLPANLPDNACVCFDCWKKFEEKCKHDSKVSIPNPSAEAQR